MDETNVQSTDDILAAADARLNAPIEPITKKVVEPARTEAAPEEPETEEESTEEDEPEPETEEESSLEVDGERLTSSQIRQLKKDATRAKDLDETRRAAEYLLQHPEEYARVRREHGLEPAPAPEPAKPTAPAGPDPVDDGDRWKYLRFNQYVAYLQQHGQTATPEAIAAQVEKDHSEARTNRMHEILLEERAERKKQAAETERQQAGWRQEQEAHAIARTLTPLFQKYPEAATPDGQEEVEARIIRAVHLGHAVDYEAIVKAVHTRNGGAAQTAVKKWVSQKKAMAAGAGPAVARGGSAQGSKAKLRDTMPADISSISAYAEMKDRGEA